nr:transposase [Xenorhabdus bovienii]
MKEKALSLWGKLMLKKRFLIETVVDQLKNISQIAHSRHRSQLGFFIGNRRWLNYLYIPT